MDAHALERLLETAEDEVVRGVFERLSSSGFSEGAVRAMAVSPPPVRRQPRRH